MVVDALVKGLRASPFSDSLLQNWVELMAEVHEQATIHFKVEEAIRRKRVNKLKKQGMYKESTCSHSKNIDTSSRGRARNLRG